jgi:hypothetical protein
MSDHNLPQILERLKWVGVLKDINQGDQMSVETPKLESKPPIPESKTDFQSQLEVTKERIKAANPESLISLVLDFMDIENTIKKEYAAANMLEKKKLVRWFSMGLLFMFGSMCLSLWALGALGTPIIIDWVFMTKFISGTLASLGLGFIVSKVKDEMTISIKSDKNYLLNVIQKASYKLSNM